MDQLADAFPALDGGALGRVARSRDALESHLTHALDLTPVEASETLDDWLLFTARSPPPDQESAA